MFWIFSSALDSRILIKVDKLTHFSFVSLRYLTYVMSLLACLFETIAFSKLHIKLQQSVSLRFTPAKINSTNCQLSFTSSLQQLQTTQSVFLHVYPHQ